MKNDIESPHLPDIAVSDSTTQTFSDKLTMFHMSLLMSAGIGNYATAGAASQRSDLMIKYKKPNFSILMLRNWAFSLLHKIAHKPNLGAVGLIPLLRPLIELAVVRVHDLFYMLGDLQNS